MTNLGYSQTVRVCRRQFKIFNLNENSDNFSRRVENAVGKGEIACYKQFLFIPQYFQKACSADTYKHRFVWERVKT